MPERRVWRELVDARGPSHAGLAEAAHCYALRAGAEVSTATPCCRLFSSAVRRSQLSPRHARANCSVLHLLQLECQTACE
jgi:hypothetical protein